MCLILVAWQAHADYPLVVAANRDEFFEVFSVGLVVGGSIVIPHLRRAVDFLDQLETQADSAHSGV